MESIRLGAEMTNEWALECVKHLAIINAAGLAGAATLAGLGKPIENADPVTSAKWFIIGLFAAFVCLYMGYDMNMRGMKRFRRRLDDFFQGIGTTADFQNLEPVAYKRAMVGVALVSAATFIVGVYGMLPFDIKPLAFIFQRL